VELPANVTASKLYALVAQDGDLLFALKAMRKVVEALAQTTNATVPSYTDHTVRHMDALWAVSDEIITEPEIARMTSAEAFLLGAAFYLHDIGMAYAATPEGLKRLQASAPYRSYMSGVPEQHRSEPASAANAVAIAVRQLHADAANELATGEIPGTSGIYIFPDKIFREAWGATCGKIASSHHWTVPDLEVHFGLHRSIPLPGGRDADLLYVAACLRLIDYAHINRDRASSLDRAFRYSLGHESLIHWLAQENVDGPLRDSADYLIYRAARPIAHVDSWWLYYEMIIGLDTEIRAVTRALDRAGSTYKQLSLRGVRGATSPEEAASYFPTSGFLPIEVNLRTGSIDKLVELLAGETLYGPNPMAAVRELIQNARDAVMLKAEIAANDVERATLALPISVTISTAGSSPYLEIIDYGIGMTKTVITDYLISIASDYWTTQFRRDFPALAMKGFKSAGKFGIGFLSVFMLGDEVSVESNRTGEERYRLSLRGVGRRGELQKVKSPTGSGTSVRVSLRKNALETLKNSRTLLPLYAPTLPHDLRIIIDGVDTVLKDGWVASISCDDLRKWTAEAERVLTRQMNVRSRSDSDGFDELYMRRRYFLASYDGSKKSNIWKVRWPEYVN
jgi:histidine kinase/DNA gyrase B/HSP90-like ATPase